MSKPLVKEVRIACSCGHAFAVFTGRVDLWWPPGHRPSGTISMHLEPEEGGAFYAVRASDRVELGQVVHVDSPTSLQYTWNPGRGVGPTLVRVDFIDTGDATLVRVTHREAESQLGDEWPERVGIFDNAWEDVLRQFAEFAARQPEEM